ncbi:hypothetical protein LCGC14_0545920 [marine sediment metagenome]|uniref:Uncharacterized protein n=1 Tax=marine sediment metagenome TaxID=412755 RepID=A0A0F9S9S7_9ZZZZ
MISKELIITLLITIAYLMLTLNYGTTPFSFWYSGLLVGFSLCWILLEIWENKK